MAEPRVPLGRADRASPGRGAWDLPLLIEQFTDRVHRFLLSMIGDGEMARDLTQETFLKLQSADPRLPDRFSAAAYVLAAARNTALSHLRRRTLERRHVSLHPPEELEAIAGRAGSADPSRDRERSELRTALLRALADLPEEQRAAFLLSEVERLSYEEIAGVMACSSGTVASRKHAAVEKLRRDLRRNGFAL